MLQIMESLRHIFIVVCIFAFSSFSQGQNLKTVQDSPWWSKLELEPLFKNIEAGTNTPGWFVIGGDKSVSYTWVKDPDPKEGTSGMLLKGTGRAPNNAFLTSEKIYGDFLLEIEVRIDKDGGNSGIQIRRN